MAELRRWIRGPEGRARTRMRGLEERLSDLIADDEHGADALEEAVAGGVRAGGRRLAAAAQGGGPRGPGEVFLAAAYRHVRARSSRCGRFLSLEAEPQPMARELLERCARARRMG